MCAVDSGSRKPLIRIGTLGDVGHGKTTLASAIMAVQSRRGLAEHLDASTIRSMQDTSGGQARIGFETDTRRYELIDCPGHADFLTALLSGAAQLDGAVLIVSAVQGPTNRTQAYIQLAQRFGVVSPVVFLSHCDASNPARLDSIEESVRAMLSAAGYPGKEVPVIRGSSQDAVLDQQRWTEPISELLEALEQVIPVPAAPDGQSTADELWTERLTELMEEVDQYVPEPERPDLGGGVLMPIEEVFSVQGRGTVVSGSIRRGSLNPGDEVQILGPQGTQSATVETVEISRLPPGSKDSGERADVVLRTSDLEWTNHGAMLTRPGAMDWESLESVLAGSDLGGLSARGSLSIDDQEDETWRYGAKPYEPIDGAIFDEADDESAEETTEATPPRFLSAEVREMPGERVERRRLVVGREYLIEVDIGSEIEGRVTAQRPFSEDQLPKDREVHPLRVVFVEPNHAPAPQEGSVSLPARSGRSSSCLFHFEVQPDKGDFEARIAVYHGCRVIQTALLTAPVADNQDEIFARSIEMKIETVIRTNPENTWSEVKFAGSLILNRSGDGTPRMLATTPDRSILLSLEGVKELLNEIKLELTEVAYAPEDYEDLLGDKMQKLLLYLAYTGSILHDQLCEAGLDLARSDDQPLGDPRTAIQIVATKTSSLLPLEYVYEYSPSQTAKLCLGARRAVKEGRCQGCDGRDEKPSSYICPLGFWCTSRILERHSYDSNDRRDLRPSEFRIQSDPSAKHHLLRPLRSAGLAVSDQVNSVQTDAGASLLRAIQQRVPRSFHATDWTAWKESAMESKPALIVLLPHTVKVLGAPAMEIGADDVLGRQGVFSPHLGLEEAERHRQPTWPPDQRPIVLLLGCETQKINIPFQSLVSRFRQKGAAIVVSTLTPVLGRNAARVAVLFLEVLASIADDTPLGEVMRRLRLRALAEGQAAVLCLFADGDADWRLISNTEE